MIFKISEFIYILQLIKKMKYFPLIVLFIIISISNSIDDPLEDDDSPEAFFSTTWGTAILNTESPKLKLSKNSIRQIVHISASGSNLRVKLSNRIGKSDLEIKEITVADSISQGTGDIDPKTLAQLTFDGKKSTKIGAGKEIYTDVIPYNLKSLSEIAISIYFGSTPDNLSGHPGSRTYSFIEEGNTVQNQTFSTENKIDHWYFIEAVEVYSNPVKSTVVCFGDSITDGHGSSNDKQNRWTDFLSVKLHLNKDTSEVAVVNKGINGNRITTQGIERFSHDVLEVKGVSHVLVLYGVNDINLINATSADVILAYKQIIAEAHKNKLLIFAGTILPYGKFYRWTEQREKYRQEINSWIRTTKSENGGFDAVFDFDDLLKDPKDETKLYEDYDSGDGLHPSPEGYLRVVQAIDKLKLFARQKSDDSGEGGEIKIVDKIGIKFKLDFVIEKNDNIEINIKGLCQESNGFRVLTNNEEGEKTSDYYYSGNLDEGDFELNIKIKVYDDSNYIVIRRPLSTINIDNIIFDSIEVIYGDESKIFTSLEEGEILKE